MLLIRIAGLLAIICLHVWGGAVLFRRLFPRESPWWGFFLPALAVVLLFNFVEHFIALPLSFLLPYSTGLSAWIVATYAASWRKLLLPGLLFFGAFAFALGIKCLEPDVNFYNTEGLTDLTRILDFCLGDRLPPTDCWLPPYAHTGYYTFMHYGASIIKRLLWLDIGTGYNLSFAFVNALTLLAGAAVAHSLSRYRAWVAVVVLIVLAGGFTGSTPIRAILHPSAPDPASTIDISGECDQSNPTEFEWLLKRTPPKEAFRLFTPGCYIYYTEFHATLGGQLVLLLTAFAAAEALRRKRTVFPWIFLVVAPFLIILTCPWLFLMTAALAWPTLLLAWWVGRRPPHWSHVFLGSSIALALFWPTFCSFALTSAPPDLHIKFNLFSDGWMIVIQWWPIYVPWILLWFAWKRLNLTGRWLLPVMALLFLLVETIHFSNRGICLEKTWGSFFGLGVVLLYPLVFAQKGWLFRGVSVVLISVALISIAAWISVVYPGNDWSYVMHLEGNSFIRQDSQLLRMTEVLSRLHGKTVLAGKAQYAFFDSTCLPAFTENRCYLGWTNAEETTGHPDEAQMREKLDNAFYDGTMTDPVNFLEANGIAAVLIWPEDKMSDDFITKMKSELASGYAYVDCKMDGAANAGVFLKKLDP